MYDELRTQYSVLEAYSAKLDDKVVDLEELIESMDQLNTPKPDTESSRDENFCPEEVQNLRSENEWLKDIIIRFTREDVSNIREDSLRLPSRDFPITKSSTLNLQISKSSLTPQSSDSDIPAVQDESDLKGKLTSTTLQLRKQISSKKIPKIRTNFRELENLPPKREVSQSMRRPPSERKNVDLGLDKKVGFDAIINAASNGLNLNEKLPEPPLTDRPSFTGSHGHPMRTNSINYKFTDPTKQNGKPSVSTTLLSSHSDSAIGGRSQVNHDPNVLTADTFMNEIARRLSGKWSLPEVPKLPHEQKPGHSAAQCQQGKELVMEKEKAEMRKQVEDMRMNLDKIVHVVTHLTEKYC